MRDRAKNQSVPVTRPISARAELTLSGASTGSSLIWKRSPSIR
ncbi:hypothetical protein GCM10022252_68490 [Streptosporangium oxazolinicum]|uniref:Uncharacterized protein n=1 Tax=Streptosporangium oxazolinicum TaxID=909287 RepID=A0ABP8BGN1_9ACTN